MAGNRKKGGKLKETQQKAGEQQIAGKPENWKSCLRLEAGK